MKLLWRARRGTASLATAAVAAVLGLVVTGVGVSFVRLTDPRAAVPLTQLVPVIAASSLLLLVAPALPELEAVSRRALGLRSLVFILMGTGATAGLSTLGGIWFASEPVAAGNRNLIGFIGIGLIAAALHTRLGLVAPALCVASALSLGRRPALLPLTWPVFPADYGPSAVLAASLLSAGVTAFLARGWIRRSSSKRPLRRSS